MNDDTLERTHNFVSQLIEQCHSHLPGVHLMKARDSIRISFNYIVTEVAFQTLFVNLQSLNF